MNRRTFIKYLSCAPIALATLLTGHPTSSVVRKKEKDDPGHTGVSRQQLEELARATLKDMPKMKGWEIPSKELGQKEEPKTFYDFWKSEKSRRCWYVFDKGFPQKEKEKMIKALRLELKNHKFQKNI